MAACIQATPPSISYRVRGGGAMIKATPSLRRLRRFINQAELQWYNVVEASRSGKVIVIGGTDYYQLPLRFSTKAKVLAYFRRYWGINLSNLMFCNLKTIKYRGRLYVIAGDPSVVSLEVKTLRIISDTSTRFRVRAVLTGGPDDNVVIYTFSRLPKDRFKIIARTNKRIYDAFLPCP